MSNILITGGAGFIGSNLCNRLYELGHKVWSLDNYSTGKTKNHVLGVDYYSGDTKNILKYFGNIKFDLVFHLGEYSRVEQSFTEPDVVFNFNLTGTAAVLDYCHTTKSKLIYAGSSTKFGDIGPNSSPYAFSKATNTELVKNYGNWYGLDYAITYFYNVYGKNEIDSGKYATLIAKFLNRKKQGLPLSITLPGMQKRNFTHIDDIVDALVLVGFHGSGDGYGIGAKESYSVLEVAKMVGGPIEFYPETVGNRLTADLITEKTKALGWKQKRNLKNYIEQNT